MLSINVFIGGQSYHFETKDYGLYGFIECLQNVDRWNTKLITFHDELSNVGVSISPLSSIITYKEKIK